jgi:hypothetical protein
MKMNGFRTLCLTLALGLTLIASGARAQDQREQKAKAELDKAVALQAQGELEQALAAYQRAYAALPNTNVLWNIAGLQAELGKYAEAKATYQRYLEEGTDKVPVSRAAKARREIARFDTMLGELRVVSRADGLLIFIDGKQLGVTPLDGPLTVAVGQREVVVRRGKKEVFRQFADVSRGKATEVRVEEGTGLGETGGGGAREEGAGDGGRVWTWVALGVGGAALVAGGITGGMVLSRSGDLEDGCPDKQCPESEWSTLDGAETLATVTNVLLGVGAAAVLAGAILFFVEPGLGGEKQIAVTPSAGSSGAGIALSGRF